ncbi:MAG: hypothetical protein GF330_06765 [Candidatus Eisenbacteria bacterium]|nr:hypothetical protein [Candidatus Eisenbacteria bacterium]
MRFGTCLALAALILAFPSAGAGSSVHTITLDQQSAMRLIETSGDVLIFEATVGELAGLDVATPQGIFTQLVIPGFQQSREIGRPCVPMMNRLCELPHGAAAEVTILDSETQRIRLADHGIEHPLLPAQPSVPKDADPSRLPFHIDAAAYAPGAVTQREPVAVTDVGQLRAVRIGRIEVSPVAYDPGAGELTVHTFVRFEVRFPGADLTGTRLRKAESYSPFFEIVYDRLAGYRAPHDDHPDLMDGPVGYVIVADRMFESALQPFVDWKTQQGFRVTEAYTDVIGDGETEIQTYLHDLYDNASPPPTFVLFVGDVDTVPAFYSQGPTDLYYCEMNGDNIPEMYYGRFSARNVAELETQIEKTLEYEMATFPDPAFLGEVVLIAGVDPYYASSYGNGQVNYGTRHYFNAAHGILSHTYLYPESGGSGPEIIQNVSDGVAFVNYSAHGYSGGWANPSFTNSDIDGLQNEHEYCLAIGNCCDTSTFNNSDCFAEHWLRADSKGAIGYIGGANSTYWDEDYWWGVGAGPVVPSGADYDETGLGVYDGLWHDHGEAIDQWYVVQDAMIFCGNLAVVEGNGWSSYYWRIYNLMGDPSLSPYLGLPTENEVTCDEFIDPQDGPLPVTFEVSAEPNSYVGLTKSGQVVGSGMIGASGSGTISVFGHGTSGLVQMVVTCQNKYPYICEIPVSDPAGIGETAAGPRLALRAAPNPLRPDTRILLNLDAPQSVALRIHDTTGRVVRTLVEGSLSAGEHFYAWDGRDARGRSLPGGVYLARLQAERGARAWKLVLSE